MHVCNCVWRSNRKYFGPSLWDFYSLLLLCNVPYRMSSTPPFLGTITLLDIIYHAIYSITMRLIAKISIFFHNFIFQTFCVTSSFERDGRPKAVLRIQIRDPMLFWPLDPGSGKNPDPGWTSQIIFLRAYYRDKMWPNLLNAILSTRWDGWMISSLVVRASDCQCQSLQQSWVRFQHPLTQWNLRGRQMKQCWIQYIEKKNPKNLPVFDFVHACMQLAKDSWEFFP